MQIEEPRAIDMESGLVLFLGMVRRGEFETLQHQGLPLGVLVDTNSKQRLADVSRFSVVEYFDFSRPITDLIDAVRGIRRRHSLACLFNVIEFYVAQTAEVATALGLTGISSASARLCLDKSLMRERFRERIGADAVGRFHVVSSEDELMEFANELGYPVFLQPSNVSASMWSTRNETREMLLHNYRAMQSEVPQYYTRLGQHGKKLVVVISEYLDGDNKSIDCLVDSGGHVYTTPTIDVLTGRNLGIDDFHHFARVVPSQMSATDEKKLEQLAVAGVQALDMKTSAAHVEFIGSRLGEIGARPGGNRPRILELAFGIDLLYAYYRILRNESPHLHRQRERAAALVTPFPPANGVLKAIQYLDRLPKLPGYLYHEVRAQPGQAVGLARSGYRAPLYVELVSADAGEIHESVGQIASWKDLYVVN